MPPVKVVQFKVKALAITASDGRNRGGITKTVPVTPFFLSSAPSLSMKRELDLGTAVTRILQLGQSQPKGPIWLGCF